MKKIDEATLEFIFNGAFGWRKLFENAQSCVREVLKYSAVDIPDDLYLKCIKIVNVHELPKRYQKGVKNETSTDET